MRKTVVLLVSLLVFSITAVSNDYVNDHSMCTERTMCDDPDEYPNVDYMDEVNIEGDSGELWSGTIDIRNVTFMHNFTEKVTNTGFQNRDTEGPRDEDSKDKIVRFDGVMKTDSLCNEPVFDVDIEKSSRYKIDVYGNDTYGVRSCHDHPVKVEYTLNLQTQTTDMEVVVNQSNVTESFQTEDFHDFEGGVPEGLQDDEDEENKEEPGEGVKQENGGLLDGAIGIFSSYFGVFTGYF